MLLMRVSMSTGMIRMTKPKEETPLSDVDVLMAFVDSCPKIARIFRELNEEIDRLKAENAKLQDEKAGLENRIDQLDS
jgi:hypothetical protein